MKRLYAGIVFFLITAATFLTIRSAVTRKSTTATVSAEAVIQQTNAELSQEVTFRVRPVLSNNK
jgi:hypothetical protein